MSTLALVDCTTYLAGYDVTGDTNAASLAFGAEELEATTFAGGGYRARKGGLKTTDASLDGFWGAGASSIDTEAFTNLGTADRVVTMIPTGAENSVAYLFQAGQFTYEQFGAIGEMTPFSLGMLGTNPVGGKRGLLTKAKGNVSATGATGTAIELPAVGASEFLYATFHVFTAGTTITAVVESDDNAGFTSATTRISFTGVTAAGGTWGTRVAGAISDTHYRLRVTAVTGTFSIACAVAVGA